MLPLLLQKSSAYVRQAAVAWEAERKDFKERKQSRFHLKLKRFMQVRKCENLKLDCKKKLSSLTNFSRSGDVLKQSYVINNSELNNENYESVK